MGTTDQRGLPYPEATDTPFVHLDLKKLADAVDDTLGAPPGPWTAVTLAAGWAWSGAQARARDLGDGRVQITGGRLVRTTALATGTGSGYTMFTLPAGLRPYATQFGAASHGIAGQMGGCPLIVGADGVFQFISFLPNGTMDTSGSYGNGVIWPALFLNKTDPTV